MGNQVKKYNKLIIALSIIVPLTVLMLFRIKIDYELPVFLPPVYASINTLTALILIAALIAIKNGKRKLHEILIKSAMGLTVLFLILYIVYHATSEETPYGGTGFMRYVYFFTLISHIVLSVTVIPFVLISFVRAINNETAKHRKIARIAFPLWLYVVISGVLVFLMISPYYP